MAATFRAVLFDLDDTLYEERLFFRSGFGAVAEALDSRGFGPRVHVVELLEHFHHDEGREQVFQKLADRLIFPADWIPELVTVFRSHTPDIRLADDVLAVLPRLRRQYKLGCVTDGWGAIQRSKLAALGVQPLLDAIVIADDYGRDRWKPHPFPFYKCCELLGAAPEACVFVGDNPERDLRGARNAGLRCIRMRRVGSYFARVDSSQAELAPECEVCDLVELEERLSKF